MCLHEAANTAIVLTWTLRDTNRLDPSEGFRICCLGFRVCMKAEITLAITCSAQSISGVDTESFCCFHGADMGTSRRLNHPNRYRRRKVPSGDGGRRA